MNFLRIIFILAFFSVQLNSKAQSGAFVKAIVKTFVKEDGTKTVYIWEKSTFKTSLKTTPKYKFESKDLYNDFNKKNSKGLSNEISYLELIQSIDRHRLYGDVKISQHDLSEMRHKAELEYINSGQAEKDRRFSQELSAKRMVAAKLPSTPSNPISNLSLSNIENADVFISIPSNADEFKNIFGPENFNNRQLNAAINIKNTLINEKNENIKFSSSASEFLKTLTSNSRKSSNSEREKSIILIGHNQNGYFYFPDGSRLEIAEIDNIAQNQKRIIVFLSCNASEHTSNPAASYYLTYPEAIQLVPKLNHAVPKELKKNREQIRNSLQTILDNYGKEKAFKFKLKIIGYTTVAGVAGYGVYEVRKDK